MTRRQMYAFILPLFLVAACGPTGARADANGNGNVDANSSFADAPFGQPDGPITPPGPDGDNSDAVSQYPDSDINGDAGSCQGTSCPNPVNDNCGNTELCGPNGAGDGTDDDCDLTVDEGCSCAIGDVQPCFLGQPGRRGVGSCVDGSQTCQANGEFGVWGPCAGGIWPSSDQCDTQDNDCNGCVDDNPACCQVDLMCPGPGDLPDGRPFQDYVIDGTQFYAGTVNSWTWTVEGGPCDQLLGNGSFTLTGQNTSQLTFTPTLSGDYTVTVTIVTPTETLTCTFIIHIGGPGVRVELCWDTTGPFGADIDLHVHRSGSTANWFSGVDDCEYSNCTVPGLAWGYADSPLAECSGTPSGALWTLLGVCKSPRLDLDNIITVGTPENINIDTPNNGDTFRVMVHYYGGNVVTRPMVNIYCGGNLLATYGQAPDLVNGFNAGGGRGGGPMWRAVDITAQVNGNGDTTGCSLNSLGLIVTNNDTTF